MSSHSKQHPNLSSPSTSSRGRSTPGGDGEGRGGPPAKRYKGVWMRKWGSWVAEVRRPNSRARIWLGSYDTVEKAARAHDAAVLCLRGPRAYFNFPDSLPADIPTADGGGGLTHEQIREVAARHARGAPAVPRQEAELAVDQRAREGADVGVEGGTVEWPEDPLYGFPSPAWTVHYGEEADHDSSPEGSGGEAYSLWSFSSEDGPPSASS